MFQIKICGIRSVKDAQLAALAGADAIGLNFYDQSPRCIGAEAAEKIVKVLPPRIVKVGVFVNASPDEVARVVQLLNLDMIQLHGDEPPGMLPAFPPRSILRAFRCGDNGFVAIEEYLEHCKGLRLPDAILLDGCKPGEYGGTGRVIDWQALADNRHRFPGLPLVLAGGLTPFNVADAIGAVRPDAVDTASGVETEQGQKDPMLVRAFVTSSKRAFAAMKTA